MLNMLRQMHDILQQVQDSFQKYQRKQEDIIDQEQKEYNELVQAYKEQNNKLTKTEQENANLQAFKNKATITVRDKQTEINKLNVNKDDLEKQIKDLKDRNLFLEQQKTQGSLPPAKPQSVSVPVSGSVDTNILDNFNRWGSNLVIAVPPQGFRYIKGEMKSRCEQPLDSSDEEENWLINTTGTQRYLFPNPWLFDELTNIDSFYKMDKNRLKGKGKNKIRIIRPCEISDKGWVNYPGELELL
jgi:hypothetical protein